MKTRRRRVKQRLVKVPGIYAACSNGAGAIEYAGFGDRVPGCGRPPEPVRG